MNPDTRVCRRCIDAVEFRALARGFDDVEPAFLGMSPRWVRCAQHPFIEPAARKIIATNAALLNSGQVGSLACTNWWLGANAGAATLRRAPRGSLSLSVANPAAREARHWKRAHTMRIRGLGHGAGCQEPAHRRRCQTVAGRFRTTTVRTLAVRKLRAVRRQRLSGSIVVSRRRHDRQERRSRLCRY